MHSSNTDAEFAKGDIELENKTYIAIDLKSFYASVECVDRGLDPLDTNLVVADMGRTEKTICLAVSPAMTDISSEHISTTISSAASDAPTPSRER